MHQQNISYEGTTLTAYQQQQVVALAACSSHPLSKALAGHLGNGKKIEVTKFKESAGKGIEGFVNGDFVKLGSGTFVTGQPKNQWGTSVFISIEDKIYGRFEFSNHYRDNIVHLLKDLKNNYRLSVLSGDNDAEKENLQKILGKRSMILFHQQPVDKLHYIEQLQQRGEKVMMIGDGLNDAGALKQSDIGIAVAEQTNHFTPSSDAIIEAKQITRLTKFICLCRANRNIVMTSFVLSIVYNIIGLSFAVQGTLSPLVAAILMPCSSLSILLITVGSSNLLARRIKLL
jgi:Cu+-exporting ATPase